MDKKYLYDSLDRLDAEMAKHGGRGRWQADRDYESKVSEAQVMLIAGIAHDQAPPEELKSIAQRLLPHLPLI